MPHDNEADNKADCAALEAFITVEPHYVCPKASGEGNDMMNARISLRVLGPIILGILTAMGTGVGAVYKSGQDKQAAIDKVDEVARVAQTLAHKTAEERSADKVIVTQLATEVSTIKTDVATTKNDVSWIRRAIERGDHHKDENKP